VFRQRRTIVLKLSRIAVLVALGVGLALAGCGDDDEDDAASTPPPPPAQTETAAESSGDAQKLRLSADAGGALKFDKSSLTADAGTVEIEMDNPAQIPHNVAVEGNGVEEQGPVVEQGGTSMVTVDLDAGTYEFYCSVGNHREAGMEGTLTVR
jgi:plastocyanin